MFDNKTTFKFKFNTKEMGPLEFVGETEAEARGYATMAGWTVVGKGEKVEPPAPVQGPQLPSYETWCHYMGFAPN